MFNLNIQFLLTYVNNFRTFFSISPTENHLSHPPRQGQTASLFIKIAKLRKTKKKRLGFKKLCSLFAEFYFIILPH
ncbi:hypothetical protein CDSM653_01716 [Caldanaerobacter subterraneus subsp. pacificus DSM 12653]|uniref:Uncharacterized protein n=1 Tax=Caldanaerobacter subterraneus subsp. pacificus DSM 12653 TaxID=391606 RepID=A0A0F5PKY9_9THEO|nr:hypothetical protein CDSM653_01716 [Caldanaerobacter subterraneus subsp. pacificus DSM 12653]